MKKFFLTFDFDGDIVHDIFYGEDYGDVIYWAMLKYGQNCEKYLTEFDDK